MEKGYYKFYVDALEDHWSVDYLYDDPGKPILKLKVVLTDFSANKKDWTPVDETTVEAAMFFYGKQPEKIVKILKTMGVNKEDLENPVFSDAIYKKGQEIVAIRCGEYVSNQGEEKEKFELVNFPSPVDFDALKAMFEAYE